jgi:hypothetical protein
LENDSAVTATRQVQHGDQYQQRAKDGSCMPALSGIASAFDGWIGQDLSLSASIGGGLAIIAL